MILALMSPHVDFTYFIRDIGLYLSSLLLANRRRYSPGGIRCGTGDCSTSGVFQAKIPSSFRIGTLLRIFSELPSTKPSSSRVIPSCRFYRGDRIADVDECSSSVPLPEKVIAGNNDEGCRCRRRRRRRRRHHHVNVVVVVVVVVGTVFNDMRGKESKKASVEEQLIRTRNTYAQPRIQRRSPRMERIYACTFHPVYRDIRLPVIRYELSPRVRAHVRSRI